jgi:hypothetical protein
MLFGRERTGFVVGKKSTKDHRRENCLNKRFAAFIRRCGRKDFAAYLGERVLIVLLLDEVVGLRGPKEILVLR